MYAEYRKYSNSKDEVPCQGFSAKVVTKRHSPSATKRRLLEIDGRMFSLHVLANIHSGRRTNATYAKGVLTLAALKTVGQIFALIKSAGDITFVTVPSEQLRRTYFGDGKEKGVTIYIPREVPEKPTHHVHRFPFLDYVGFDALNSLH